MTTTWTPITKASGTAYTNAQGGHIAYNDPNITYDDANVTYDGLNNQGSGYTNVAKASGTTWTNISKAT